MGFVRFQGTDSYLASAELRDAVNVAIALERPLLIRGEPGHAIIDELGPRDGEPVFDKPGFGAFYRTDLEAHLREAGITHLVVCGITTQCCVHSTLRSAVDAFARLVVRAQAQGDIPADRDPADVAVFLVNSIWGLRVMCRADNDRHRLNAVAAGILASVSQPQAKARFRLNPAR